LTHGNGYEEITGSRAGDRLDGVRNGPLLRGGAGTDLDIADIVPATIVDEGQSDDIRNNNECKQATVDSEDKIAEQEERLFVKLFCRKRVGDEERWGFFLFNDRGSG
jgi:hypothetical protein